MRYMNRIAIHLMIMVVIVTLLMSILFGCQETAIQGFIPAGLAPTYVPHLKAGSVYRLNKFYGSRNKVQYSVADHSVTISFGWNSVLSVLTDSPVPFHEDRFRFRSHAEFEANCDLKGGLYGKSFI